MGIKARRKRLSETDENQGKNGNDVVDGQIGSDSDVVSGDQQLYTFSGQPYNKRMRNGSNESIHCVGGGASDNSHKPNWRDQIYYWSGNLSLDTINNRLFWKGSWIGSYVGRPESQEFINNPNLFEYSGPEVDPNIIISKEGYLHPISGYFGGYYLMDNDGSGKLETYDDKSYMIEFEHINDSSPPRYSVFGKGESDFGVFIVTGTYDAASRELEMARQYLEDTDERVTMSIAHLKRITALAKVSNSSMFTDGRRVALVSTTGNPSRLVQAHAHALISRISYSNPPAVTSAVTSAAVTTSSNLVTRPATVESESTASAMDPALVLPMATVSIPTVAPSSHAETLSPEMPQTMTSLQTYQHECGRTSQQQSQQGDDRQPQSMPIDQLQLQLQQENELHIDVESEKEENTNPVKEQSQHYISTVTSSNLSDTTMIALSNFASV